ncbi:MAG: acVLRF1 family peptidyl-tRNA hydrolase [Actinomycetia bacterium]|nr:acVLRF1 family peptidyl-tRNA hydrolase [Actinomycetes bacterium]
MPRTVYVPASRFPGWLERFETNNPDGPQRIVEITEPLPVPLAALLIRRGGYAVAVVDSEGRLAGHKVGTRYVQSRTAAGGWSQQRFARRRENQADALVGAVQDHLERVLRESGITPAGLITGGDRQLTADVLADARLAALHDLPTRAIADIPDPRRAVLEDTIARAGAYVIVIDDGPIR